MLVRLFEVFLNTKNLPGDGFSGGENIIKPASFEFTGKAASPGGRGHNSL